MHSSFSLTCGWLLRLTWRHTHVCALLFRSEPIAVAFAASIPEDAADLVFNVVEPVLFPASAVLTLVPLQLTHVVWRVIWRQQRIR